MDIIDYSLKLTNDENEVQRFLADFSENEAFYARETALAQWRYVIISSFFIYRNIPTHSVVV
jgi:hypothetical protein